MTAPAPEDLLAGVTDPVDRARRLAKQVRRDALRMCHRANASHIGGCLSMADLLGCLYGNALRVDPHRPEDPARDRFVLSKGHGAAGLYAALAARGFFPRAWLDDYCTDGARLGGHVTHHGVPGVEHSTGSLGHGLSVAAGMALAARGHPTPWRAFCLLSDGECDEGATWEAALFAPQQGLENLVAVVDYNKIQSFGRVREVLDLEPFADKWRAARWGVRELDGHDVTAVLAALDAVPFEAGRPSVILAHTVKGRGVSFMEDALLWHYRAPNEAQLAAALAEVEAAP